MTISIKTSKLARRHKRVRAKVAGSSQRPRLAVYKSNRYLHVQLIDDIAHKSVLGLSSGDKKSTGGNKVEQARGLGVLLAKEAMGKKIAEVVFDRGGFKYTGRVRAFAEGAREGGLKF